MLPGLRPRSILPIPASLFSSIPDSYLTIEVFEFEFRPASTDTDSLKVIAAVSEFPVFALRRSGRCRQIRNGKIRINPAVKRLQSHICRKIGLKPDLYRAVQRPEIRVPL